MIRGFEEFTAELNDYERITLLPAIYHGMITKLGKENAISAAEAIKAMKHHGYKITAPRFRKIMHVIRTSGMIKGILGTSKGYFIARTNDEYLDYLVSINQRLEHIQSLRDALTAQYAEFKNRKDFT
jgi:predicted RNA-binding protein associated with RNAse of E/G family